MNPRRGGRAGAALATATLHEISSGNNPCLNPGYKLGRYAAGRRAGLEVGLASEGLRRCYPGAHRFG